MDRIEFFASPSLASMISNQKRLKLAALYIAATKKLSVMAIYSILNGAMSFRKTLSCHSSHNNCLPEPKLSLCRDAPI